eukprot:TRINITY_DN18363_c0_g1_i1.p1 TRINITY_DN18363_c0_g1~~TRINITY_DN18363_c0_g1_i1.p1  ORF type:complete len:949 (-),score=145.85 TRINITY_DN18363_c0_g1_i1:77-2923(-)
MMVTAWLARALPLLSMLLQCARVPSGQGAAPPRTCTVPCAPDEYKEAPLVVLCDGGSCSAEIQLRKGQEREVVTLPAGLEGVRVEMVSKTGTDMDLELKDLAGGLDRCIAGAGCVDGSVQAVQGCATVTDFCIDYAGMSWYFSGDAQSPPVKEDLRCQSRTTRILDVVVKASSGGTAALTNYNDKLLSCPESLPGCKKCEEYTGCGAEEAALCDGSATVVCLPPTTTTVTFTKTSLTPTSTTSSTLTSFTMTSTTIVTTTATTGTLTMTSFTSTRTTTSITLTQTTSTATATETATSTTITTSHTKTTLSSTVTVSGTTTSTSSFSITSSPTTSTSVQTITSTTSTTSSEWTSTSTRTIATVTSRTTTSHTTTSNTATSVTTTSSSSGTSSSRTSSETTTSSRSGTSTTTLSTLTSTTSTSTSPTTTSVSTSSTVVSSTASTSSSATVTASTSSSITTSVSTATSSTATSTTATLTMTRTGTKTDTATATSTGTRTSVTVSDTRTTISTTTSFTSTSATSVTTVTSVTITSSITQTATTTMTDTRTMTYSSTASNTSATYTKTSSTSTRTRTTKTTSTTTTSTCSCCQYCHACTASNALSCCYERDAIASRSGQLQLRLEELQSRLGWPSNGSSDVIWTTGTTNGSDAQLYCGTEWLFWSLLAVIFLFVLVVLVGACFLYRSRNARSRLKKQVEVAQEALRGAILLETPQCPKAETIDAGVGLDASAPAAPGLSEQYNKYVEESSKSKGALQARIAALEEELRAAQQAAKYCEDHAAHLKLQLLEATQHAAASGEELNKLRRQNELLERQLVKVSREASEAVRHSCAQQDRLHEFWKKGILGLEAELGDTRNELAAADRQLQKAARAKDRSNAMSAPPPPLCQPQEPLACPPLLAEPVAGGQAQGHWQAMVPPPNLESVTQLARLKLDRRRALPELPRPGRGPTAPPG